MHSLSEAVSDGTISELSAFCGLTASDVSNLAAVHPKAQVLVRLRSSDGDGRLVMESEKLDEWRRMRIPLHIDEIWWSYSEIRDVMAVASST